VGIRRWGTKSPPRDPGIFSLSMSSPPSYPAMGNDEKWRRRTTGLFSPLSCATAGNVERCQDERRSHTVPLSLGSPLSL
jgi:hypothetical protein